ncbi:HK97 gp10 family phage protein [Klebsiella pneumoniae]|nr:HK97 gp10 family phage protein [Klebsiella pneumoniae]
MATINRAVMAQVHDRVFREVDRTAARVQREIKRRTPVDTGTTRAGWRIRYASARNTITATVYNASPVATYLHTGTGIFGPRGREIVPVRADALRFKPKGSSRYIYRMSSKGYPSSSYIIRGLRAGTNWPVTVYYPDGRAPR